MKRLKIQLWLGTLCVLLYFSEAISATETPLECQTVADDVQVHSCADETAYFRGAVPVFFACPNFGVRYRWGMGAGIEYSPPASYRGVFFLCDGPHARMESVERRRKEWLLKHEWRVAFQFLLSNLYYF